jgi:hypothetical protein
MRGCATFKAKKLLRNIMIQLVTQVRKTPQQVRGVINAGRSQD